MKRRSLLAAAGILSMTAGLPCAFAAGKEIVVGVTAGPHAEIMEVVKSLADKAGFKMRIVEFSDFVQPNAALVAGDLDMNSFQHKPYKTLADLPAKARIGIPNDPTNGSRALHMLEEQGVIKLDPKAGLRATVLDITDNPRKVRIIELDAAQLPRSLSDLDTAAINGSYAEPAGLDPKKDGLYTERADGPYANILCVREEDAKKPWVAEFIKLYQSPEVRAFVEKRYKGGMICAW